MSTELTTEQIDENSRVRWNGAHSARHHGALSGSHAEDVLRHHGISDLICPDLVVLDIGVGLGGFSKYMKSKGCVVDALDVADKAEGQVKGHIRDFYLEQNIKELPSNEYDLAVSMIVAQHMCERNLRKQILNVFRSLKPDGLFSLHLAGATEREKSNLSCEIPYAMDGAMCRDPDYALAMVADVLKGVVYTAVQTDNVMPWPKFKSYWYFVHITKGS